MITDGEVDDFFDRAVNLEALAGCQTPERLKEVRESLLQSGNPIGPVVVSFDCNSWPIADSLPDTTSATGIARTNTTSLPAEGIAAGKTTETTTGSLSDKVTPDFGKVQTTTCVRLIDDIKTFTHPEAADNPTSPAVVVDPGVWVGSWRHKVNDGCFEQDSFEELFSAMFSDPSNIPVPDYQSIDDEVLDKDVIQSDGVSRLSPSADLTCTRVENLRKNSDNSELIKKPNECVRFKWLTNCRKFLGRRRPWTIGSTGKLVSSQGFPGDSCLPISSEVISLSNAVEKRCTVSSSVTGSILCSLGQTDQPIRPEGVSFSEPLERSNSCTSELNSIDSIPRQPSPLRSILKRTPGRSSVELPLSPTVSFSDTRKLVAGNGKGLVRKSSKRKVTHNLDPWSLGFPINWSFICDPRFSIIDMHLC